MTDGAELLLHLARLEICKFPGRGFLNELFVINIILYSEFPFNK